MSVFRGPHDLLAGDRALVTLGFAEDSFVGEIRRVVADEPDRGEVRISADKDWYSTDRFMRIAEAGEIPPKGTLLRLMNHALNGNDRADFRWKDGKTIYPYVVVSLPAPALKADASEIVVLRDLLAQAERDAAKDFSLLRQRIARLEKSDE
jgi:hypothetical protein